jgi:hypothetical protein
MRRTGRPIALMVCVRFNLSLLGRDLLTFVEPTEMRSFGIPVDVPAYAIALMRLSAPVSIFNSAWQALNLVLVRTSQTLLLV